MKLRSIGPCSKSFACKKAAIHCPKNNLSRRVKTGPVTAEADANGIQYVWLILTYSISRIETGNSTIASLQPCGSILRRFRLFWVYCTVLFKFSYQVNNQSWACDNFSVAKTTARHMLRLTCICLPDNISLQYRYECAYTLQSSPL